MTVIEWQLSTNRRVLQTMTLKHHQQLGNIRSLAQRAQQKARENNWDDFSQTWNLRNLELQELVEKRVPASLAQEVELLIDELREFDEESLALARQCEQQTAQELLQINRINKGIAAYKGDE